MYNETHANHGDLSDFVVCSSQLYLCLVELDLDVTFVCG